jgi:hypothetical protein
MTVAEKAPPEDVEIEWQFDALDLRPAARWLAALGAHGPDVETLRQLRAR